MNARPHDDVRAGYFLGVSQSRRDRLLASNPSGLGRSVAGSGRRRLKPSPPTMGLHLPDGATSSREGYFFSSPKTSYCRGMYFAFHWSGTSASAKMAVTGQTDSQAPQSMHSSGWM